MEEGCRALFLLYSVENVVCPHSSVRAEVSASESRHRDKHTLVSALRLDLKRTAGNVSLPRVHSSSCIPGNRIIDAISHSDSDSAVKNEGYT
jgi:hypothetical protein